MGYYKNQNTLYGSKPTPKQQLSAEEQAQQERIKARIAALLPPPKNR